MELDNLHTFAANKATLLVGSEVFLGDDTTYGTVLHKHYGIAQALVLYLQRHTYQEGAML